MPTFGGRVSPGARTRVGSRRTNARHGSAAIMRGGWDIRRARASLGRGLVRSRRRSDLGAAA